MFVWDVKKNTLRIKSDELKNKYLDGDYDAVLAMQFVDDTKLTFFISERDEYWLVGTWELLSGKLRFGPPAPKSKSYSKVNYATLGRGGSRLVMWEDDVATVWEVRDDLSLKRLPPHSADAPKLYVDYLPPQAAFGLQGTRVLLAPGGMLAVWDVATGKMLKKTVGLDMGATMSPDGRWVAARDRDEKVLVWDLNRIDSSEAQKTFGAPCNIRDNKEKCLRLLCEKVSLSLDQKQLRELLGRDSFEQLDDMLRRAPCDRH